MTTMGRIVSSTVVLLVVVLYCAPTALAQARGRLPAGQMSRLPSRLPSYQIWDCYNDSGRMSHALQYEDMATSLLLQRNQTARQPEPCVRSCLARGFRYAGIRNINECWCGLNVTGGPERSAKCVYCTGDSRYRCGARGQIAIYYTPEHAPPRFIYQACLKYETRGERAMMNGVMREFSYISYRHTAFRQVTSCVQACANRGYMYAGVTYMFWCHCGNSMLRSRPSTCPLCQANNRQHCGTQTSMSVYRIDTGSILPNATVCGGPRKTVIHNDTLTLQCQSPGANNLFTWQHMDSSGRTVPFDRFRMSLSPKGDTLVIKNTRQMDGGRYQCTVVNRQIAALSWQTSIATATVQVEEPLFVRVTQDRAAVQNRQATLRCEVIGAGNNIISVQWRLNNVPLGPFSSQTSPVNGRINFNPQTPHVTNPNIFQQPGMTNPNTFRQPGATFRQPGAAPFQPNARFPDIRAPNNRNLPLSQRQRQQQNLHQRQQAQQNLNQRQRGQQMFNQRQQQQNFNQRQQQQLNFNQRQRLQKNLNQRQYLNAVTRVVMETNELRFAVAGNVHILTLKRVDRRSFGNYTCRVFNPQSVAEGARAVDGVHRLRVPGERLNDPFVDPRYRYQTARCSLASRFSQGDGVLIVAVVLALINAVLLALVVFLGYKCMKGKSGGGKSGPPQ